MADLITDVLLSCKVKRCAKMDHESLKLTIRHLYNPDGKAGQIRLDNFPCKRECNSNAYSPLEFYLSKEERVRQDMHIKNKYTQGNEGKAQCPRIKRPKGIYRSGTEK